MVYARPLLLLHYGDGFLVWATLASDLVKKVAFKNPVNDLQKFIGL